VPTIQYIPFCIAGIGIWLSAVISPTWAGEPSPAQLIALAPAIRSSEGKYKNVDLQGFLDDGRGSRLTFRARYLAPDHHSLILIYASDNTPAALYCDGEMMIYNPIDNYALYSNNASSNVLLAVEGASLKCSLDIVKSGRPNSNLQIDLQSLYRGTAKNDTVTKAGAGNYLLSKITERGNSLISYIDKSRICPFARVEFTPKGAEAPSVCLQEILVDEDVHAPWVTFPPKSRLEGTITLLDRSRDGLLENLSSVVFITMTCHARQAIHDIEYRQEFENNYHRRIDWRGVEANDREALRKLKMILDPYFTKP